MKIAIVVHGRLHAFDLAREMVRRGHDVKLFTNYPTWAVERFGVASRHVVSCWPEGVAFRVASRMSQTGLVQFPEASLHKWFGRWAAGRVSKEKWDVVLCWSGVAEETFQAMRNKAGMLICHRTSSHIRTQDRLLREEETRVGIRQDRPSSWMIAREEREYALANTICTPSAFVTESFINEGQPSEKVCTVRLGVETKAFRPTIGTINARRARLVSGAPLQILNIGTFSFRKGMWDLAQVIKCLDPTQFRFRFVGAVAPEAAKLVSELNLLAEFVPSQPQSELPNHYSWGDIFVLPTIEDGYQLVLAQANAAGLPIATTPNGAGRDLVIEGQNGWVLSIRDPKALVTRLLWCDAHRGEVSDMVGKIYDDFKPRDWVDVAEDFEAMCYRRSNPSTELSDVVRQISSR